MENGQLNDHNSLGGQDPQVNMMTSINNEGNFALKMKQMDQQSISLGQNNENFKIGNPPSVMNQNNINIQMTAGMNLQEAIQAQEMQSRRHIEQIEMQQNQENMRNDVMGGNVQGIEIIHQEVIGEKRKFHELDYGMEPPLEVVRKRRKKGRRKKKDPNAPRKPQTAYLIYYTEKVHEYRKKPEFRNKNGNVDMTKVSQTLGREWKLLKEEDKRIYKQKYERNKAKYEEEMNKYNQKKLAQQQDKDNQFLTVVPQISGITAIQQPMIRTGPIDSSDHLDQINNQVTSIHMQDINQEIAEKSVDEIIAEWKSLKIEKQHLIARINFLRQNFDKFGQNLKNLENDLTHLMEFLK